MDEVKILFHNCKCLNGMEPSCPTILVVVKKYCEDKVKKNLHLNSRIIFQMISEPVSGLPHSRKSWSFLFHRP